MFYQYKHKRGRCVLRPIGKFVSLYSTGLLYCFLRLSGCNFEGRGDHCCVEGLLTDGESQATLTHLVFVYLAEWLEFQNFFDADNFHRH